MSIVDPSLSNRDLAPTTPAQRTWGFYNYMALWFSMCMEITTYQLASSLIAKGMDWKQALGTVLLGNLIVLVPMLLNAHAGAKYGIPFPVFHSRAVWRARGQPAGDSARGCGLRMVRHSVVDRRHRDSCDAGRDLAVAGGQSRHFVGLLSGLLAAEHGRGVARRGVDPPPAGLWRAVHVCDGRGAADLGAHEGGQLWHDAFDAEPVPLDGTNFLLSSFRRSRRWWATGRRWR